MICDSCKTEIKGTPKFCPKCGMKVEALQAQPDAIKRCPQCGAENALAAKFCKADGYRFDSDTSVTATPGTASNNALSNTAATTSTTALRDPVTARPSEKATAQVSPLNTSAPSVTNMIICSQCGTPNAANAKFCKKDGAALVVASNVTADRPGIANVATKKATSTPPPVRPSPPRPIPMKESPPIQTRQPVTTISQAQPASSKSNVAIVVGVVAVVLAAGGGGYWYFAGHTAKTEKVAEAPPTVPATSSAPAEPIPSAPLPPSQAEATSEMVSAGITTALADAGFSKTVQTTTDADLVVTLFGSVANEEEKKKVLALVKAVAGVRDVKDQLEVAQAPVAVPPVANTVTPAKLLPPTAPIASPPSFNATKAQQDINRQFRDKGLSGVSIKVNADRSAVLHGTVNTAKEKEDAEVLVSASPELSGVRSMIQVSAVAPLAPATIDPGKLEGDINRALRNGGASGVTAQVGDDLSVTLVKQRAINAS
jgi:osmotically-inducible protein OsmY